MVDKNNSNFSALSLVTRLDISIMYSLIFSFPLYCMEISLLRIVLVSTFSFAANQFAIWSKNALAWVSSGIAPLIVSGLLDYGSPIILFGDVPKSIYIYIYIYIKPLVLYCKSLERAFILHA